MLKAGSTIAIYGGTFNPVHAAHVELVKHCLKSFEFDQFYVMPSFMPDYKAAPVAASHRLNMLKLEFASFEKVNIDEREINREGLTYTIDTVREYRHDLGENVGLFFIMGSDSLLNFDSWHDWQEILQHVNLVVVARAQEDLDKSTGAKKGKIDTTKMSSELLAEYDARMCQSKTEFMQSLSGKIFVYEELSMNVSSTKIRKKILENESTDKLLSDQIRDYIDQHSLYLDI